MDKLRAEKRVNELRDLLHRANVAYYQQAAPFISDRDFDMALAELAQLEDEHDLSDPDSPTRRVGGMPSGAFPAVEHPIPMLSLDNTYNDDELKAFDRRVSDILGHNDYTYAAELKFDGASVRLRYEEATLTLGATRGDGNNGDDITANIRTIRDIPLSLKTNSMEVLEVRGEAYMEKEAFIRLNEHREAEGLQPFANPRNSTAGSLKMQDPREVARRPIRFFAFDLLTETPVAGRTHREKLEALRLMGFPVCQFTRFCTSIDDVLIVIREWESMRRELPYDTDGVVIKVNEEKFHDELGTTSKFPRWAIAFKFEAEQAVTTLESVTLQVGRLGKITPVAELKPVLLAGTTVKRASLHNEDEIIRKDIRAGDTVIIEKAGEIIPQVVSVVNRENKERGLPFKMPSSCPACGEVLIRLEDEADWRCINPQCPPQIRERIKHFASRDAMDIDGLGEAIIDLLIEENLISNYADLYLLEKEQLIPLERMAEKSAENLIRSIEMSKMRTLDRILFGLGIRFVGKTVSKDLAASFNSIDELMEANEESLTCISSIGPKIAQSVVVHFNKKENRELIQRLKDAGLSFESAKTVTVSQKLSGMKIVITGTLPAMTRNEAREMIEKHGGSVTSSVSKQTDFLLAGDSPGSKYDKAVKLGVEILDENRFRERIGI
ncbi:MAG: NAD-dependent DNA ligase LigA [Balneolaceae bacterium]|nr:MAG: NAD-dependent DNA ligase LigA [Balneolaceae bacterium]